MKTNDITSINTIKEFALYLTEKNMSIQNCEELIKSVCEQRHWKFLPHIYSDDEFDSSGRYCLTVSSNPGDFLFIDSNMEIDPTETELDYSYNVFATDGKSLLRYRYDFRSDAYIWYTDSDNGTYVNFDSCFCPWYVTEDADYYYYGENRIGKHSCTWEHLRKTLLLRSAEKIIDSLDGLADVLNELEYANKGDLEKPEYEDIINLISSLCKKNNWVNVSESEVDYGDDVWAVNGNEYLTDSGCQYTVLEFEDMDENELE